MDVTRYLESKEKDIFPSISGYIMSDPQKGKELVAVLKESRRYLDDACFRVGVDSAGAMLMLMFGQSREVIPVLVELIDRAAALQMHRLSAVNWNNLGNAYRTLEAVERALECYGHAINIEKQCGTDDISTVAYYNISILYFSADDYEKSIEYLEFCIGTYEKGTELGAKEASKLMLNLTVYLQLLCRTGRLEKAHEVYAEICKYPLGEMTKESRFAFYVAEFFYRFYVSSDRRDCRKWYQSVRDFVEETDYVRRYQLINAYVEMCELFELDYKYYEEELKSIEDLPEVPSSYINAKLHEPLLRYYTSVGNHEKANLIREKYMNYLKQAFADMKAQQKYSLETVETLILNGNEEQLSVKNVELKMLADEALRNKSELETIYRRLEEISALGKKIISTTDLNEVVDAVFDILKANLPLETFILMVASAPNTLRSVSVYYNEKIQREWNLSVSDPDSIMARCYREGKTLVYNAPDPDFKMRREYNDVAAHSAVFSPLKVGEETIGVYTVQSKNLNSYGPEQLAFLEQFQSYIAIALNNAVHLWKLEDEIASRKKTQSMLEDEISEHKRTQANLQKAYNSLEIISSLDSLTQVSSRRDFEIKFLELIAAAIAKKSYVAVFMMDIDNFKRYNDTYGHLEGDEVLKHVATIFRKNLDTVHGLSARFGGEEFIGACEGLGSEDAYHLAENICREVYALQLEHKGSPLGVLSVSIGVAGTDNPAVANKSDLMRLADASLYAAKNSGKNRIILRNC